MNYKKIYVVIGIINDYDDVSCWPVKAFSDRDKAEEFARKASIEAIEVHKKFKRLYMKGEYDYYKLKEELRKELKYDNKMEID